MVKMGLLALLALVATTALTPLACAQSTSTPKVVAKFPSIPLDYAFLPDGRILWHDYNEPPRIFDPRLKRDLPAEALIRAFHQDPKLARVFPYGPMDWVASPDGRWLIAKAATADREVWVLASTDGGVIRQFHPVAGVAFEDEADWMWSSREWIVVLAGVKASAYGMFVTEYDLQGRPIKQTFVPGCNGLVGPVLPDLMLVDFHGIDSGTIGLRRGTSKPHWFEERFNGWGVTGGAVSPDGRTLLLNVTDGHSAPPQNRIDVYDVTSGRRHAIFAAPNEIDGDEVIIRNLTWSGDGRRVRYLYGDKLYELRVR